MFSREQIKNLLSIQTYDKNYQDIEVIDFKGYSDSYTSWNRIKELGINWRDRIVCDLGCFHGYFAMKIEQSWAAKVYGLERSADIVSVAKEIGLASRSLVEFRVWEGGQSTPKCDIALVLNMLHHCKDQDLTLQNINCEFAVFEINPPQLELIKKYFQVITIAAGREYENIENRILVYGKKLT
jgi:2-polyprenyl-3-methyl-5-hydroxy-6-metoxy-1,4-benzoquinol methylase